MNVLQGNYNCKVITLNIMHKFILLNSYYSSRGPNPICNVESNTAFIACHIWSRYRRNAIESSHSLAEAEGEGVQRVQTNPLSNLKTS